MSGAVNSVRARIRFLTIEEGGRMSWAEDGIRPQLKLGDISTSCVVRSSMGVRQFEPGVEHDVELELMHWDQYAHLIELAEPVVLLEGSRVVAKGAYVDDSFAR